MLALACGGVTEPDYGRVPVLLVHGVGDTERVWDPMISRLVSAGYPRAYLKAVRLQPSNGSSVAAATTQLGPAIDLLLEDAARASGTGGGVRVVPQRVDIVAHSMGAIAARWYAGQVAPERVRTVITLAGANRGTSTVCDWPGEGPAELCRAASDGGGPLAPLLAGDETPFSPAPDPVGAINVAPTATARIHYFAVWLDQDEWIVPSTNAQLAGAGLPDGDASSPTTDAASRGNYRIAGSGHDAFIQSRRAARIVLQLLGAVDSLSPR